MPKAEGRDAVLDQIRCGTFNLKKVDRESSKDTRPPSDTAGGTSAVDSGRAPDLRCKALLFILITLSLFK